MRLHKKAGGEEHELRGYSANICEMIDPSIQEDFVTRRRRGKNVNRRQERKEGEREHISSPKHYPAPHCAVPLRKVRS